ncbi:glycosyltransferase family 9 protein [Desulfonatronovibrio hydrogenovorans]|uniref:glycosyltransferase family 9 protein n=1 Tax=Desulfonatronovibrio hydrogenovorans TaxID=53245 RepID=UPI00068F2E54|nr:glycosyltransferase family 9 protein [Desulfonatronovibrio hydrogenovorans]
MSSETLIIQLARFGDLLQTKRLVKSLQSHSRVHLVVDHSLVDLAELVYPGSVVHGIKAHFSGPGDPMNIFSANTRSMQELSGISPDLVVNLNFSGLNFALSRLFDPGVVKGYSCMNGQEQRHPWTKLFFRLAGHRKLSPLNLVDFWGFFAPAPISPAQVNPPASSSGQGVGIVLAGRNSRRSLDLELLVSLARAARSGARSSRLFLLGSRAEQGLARKFKDLAGPGLTRDIIDLTGKTGWKELTDTVSSLELVVTPDTGTMHLAAHLGTRVLAFFISSAHCFETGPYGQGHTVFQAMPACAPCMESRKCSFDLVCHHLLKQRGIFRAMMGKGRENLEETGMFSALVDELGVDYCLVQGVDEHADHRKALRELLRRHLGLSGQALEVPQEVAGAFFHESQWMLEHSGLSLKGIDSSADRGFRPGD